MPSRHTEREMILRRSARCAYLAATSLTSVSRPSDSVVGRRPSARKRSLRTARSVQDGAVVAVVVEPVDQTLVEHGLVGLGTPDDALVQVGDAQPVVLGVEREHQLVEGLRHVVHRSGVGRVQDLPLELARRGRHLDRQVALGDRGRPSRRTEVSRSYSVARPRSMSIFRRDRLSKMVTS
jgi:hypothetical protein